MGPSLDCLPPTQDNAPYSRPVSVTTAPGQLNPGGMCHATQEMPLLLLSARVSARVPRAQKSLEPGGPLPSTSSCRPSSLGPPLPQTRPPILGSRGNGPVPEAGLTFLSVPPR